VIKVVENGAAVPAPEFPDERLEHNDKVVVDDEDVEFVAAPAKRGRPKKADNEKQLAEVLKLYFIEKMSMRQVADIVGVSHMSVYRMLSDPTVELLI
jgi:DNA-directed RNA polymerase specialized sigma subunit